MHPETSSSLPGVGETVDLDITGVAHQGVFVARDGGRVVFVSGAIPGERVRARLIETRPRFARAVALEVLDASADRRPNPVAEAAIARAPEQRVGSADLGHIALPRQRVLKQQVLDDALRRIGRFTDDQLQGLSTSVRAVGAEAGLVSTGDDSADDGLAVDVTDPAGLPANARPGLRWRTRETLHVADDGTVGHFAARSHTVVPLERLPLASIAIETLDAHRRRWAGHERVQLVTDGDSARIVLDGGHRATVTRRVHDLELLVDEAGFWQVHRDAANTLVDAVARAVDVSRISVDAPHLDLYGGVGMFGAWLARAGMSVTTVEADERAAELAAVNAQQFDRLDTRGESTEQFLKREREQASATMYRESLVVLDPPRSGAGTKVIGDLVALHPAQIVYVACDPVALARDARALADQGYRLAGLQAFDLFPHSHHFETVASFIREAASSTR
ncbi:class I SAM-dependent RNA methyltransferase [Pseudoclavibacter soli]|uniref:class I SAM-dependent RNA methyltransferase n=1 Tax=Pseudoclavibacter soli TaxID=452623 RepID=UPI0004162457|nr:TRAM domain-containing protein [Pseudoclavibacter soli]